MKLDDIIEASEEQSELLEELRELVESLEEAPADEHVRERVLEILDRLRALRSTLRALVKERRGGDAALLQDFYRMVGAHDERELLEELLKYAIKGKIELPQEDIINDIRETKEFAKELDKLYEGE